MRGVLVSDIFQEIDEELRRENFAKLWQRYGRYVFLLAALIVILTALFMGWRGYQQRQRQAEGDRYAIALDLARQGKDKEAATAFAALAKQAGSGYAALARFEEAALKVKAGDTAGAVAAYDALANDTSLEAPYRDVATLLWAQNALREGDPRAVIARLSPLAVEGGAWRPSALELTGLAQLKQGEKAAAQATFKRLADDLAAPQGLRARATEMATALAE